MELWVNELWLLFAFIMGTGAGWFMGVQSSVKDITESVIDSLIEQKYLKTKGVGRNMEILKYTEWDND